MSCDYFPSTYFTTTYFSNYTALGSEHPGPDSGTPTAERGRDRDAYQAILDTIQATGAFDQITFGTAGPRTRGGANRYPCLLLTPRSWQETDLSDPITVVRLARFTISIRVREEDPFLGFDSLDRLASLIVTHLDQSDLNGTCMPGFTKIRAGRYVPTTTPELGVDLAGEFSILYATS